MPKRGRDRALPGADISCVPQWRAQRISRAVSPHSSFPFKVRKGVVGLSFTARMERGPSEGARSASKKDGLAAPLILPLPYLTLRPLPQPFDVSLVLDDDQPAHHD